VWFVKFLKLSFLFMFLAMVNDNSFDRLSSIVLGRNAWKFDVRVVRMWEVPMFLKPEQTSSVEMILVDQFVGIYLCKACILFGCVYLFN